MAPKLKSLKRIVHRLSAKALHRLARARFDAAASQLPDDFSLLRAADQISMNVVPSDRAALLTYLLTDPELFTRQFAMDGGETTLAEAVRTALQRPIYDELAGEALTRINAEKKRQTRRAVLTGAESLFLASLANADEQADAELHTRAEKRLANIQSFVGLRGEAYPAHLGEYDGDPQRWTFTPDNFGFGATVDAGDLEFEPNEPSAEASAPFSDPDPL